MKYHQFFLFLLIFIANNSYAETPHSLNSGTAQNSKREYRVEGSQILSTTFEVQKDSATAMLLKNVVMLEKDVMGINQAKGTDAKKLEGNIRSIVSAILDLDSLAKGALATYWNDFGKTKPPTLKD